MTLTEDQIAKMSLAEIRARMLQVDIAIDAAKAIEDWGTALECGKEMEILKRHYSAVDIPGPATGAPLKIEDWIL